jgi:putative Holliday junction resolvase
VRLLGIDYGLKRVGLATSSESDRFAYPYRVLPNDSHLVSEITKICRQEGIGTIVLGESKDLSGKDNPLMKRLGVFKSELAAATGLIVEWEPEFLTTVAAERLQGKTKTLDASAAALILSSYLERQSNREHN